MLNPLSRRLSITSLLVASSLTFFAEKSYANEQCEVTSTINNAQSYYGPFGLYLESLGNGQSCSYYYRFTEGQLTENVDGSATLTGAIVSSCDDRKTFNLDFNLTDKTNSAPQGSPYNPPQGVDLSQWQYYQNFSGTLTGQDGLYNGVVLSLSKDGPSFQIGNGASSSFDSDITMSGAGWLNWNITNNPMNLSFGTNNGRGDLIVRLAEESRQCAGLINISKQVEGPDSRVMAANETATFNITVTNTSDSTLSNVVVSDPLLPSCDKVFPTLDAGETVTYNCSVDNVGDLVETATGGTEQISRQWSDSFNQQQYSNNEGTDNFLSNWVERDAYGNGPSGGLVKINSYYKDLEMTNSIYYYKKSKIERSVDLSDMETAQLTIQWSTMSWVDSTDKVVVEVATPNNGFTTLANLQGARSSLETTVINLDDYISENTRIRLRVVGYYGYHETFFMKSFAIQASGTIETPPIDNEQNAFTNEACVTAHTNLGFETTDCDTSTVVISDGLTASCSRMVYNSFPNGANDYGIWLNEHASSSQADWFFNISNGATLIEYDNGMARLQGQILSHSGEFIYDVDLHLAGETSTPPAGSPYLPGEPIDTSDWRYYTDINGTIGPFNISRRGTSFQIGTGANLNDQAYGASSWFVYGDTFGDINVQLTDCLPQ